MGKKTKAPAASKESNGHLDPNRIISPMLQILSYLAKKGDKTKSELATGLGVDISTIGIAVGESDPENRAKGDARRRYHSLLTRKHAKVTLGERGKKAVTLLAITDSGKQFLVKHVETNGKVPPLSKRAGTPRGPNKKVKAAEKPA